MEIKNHKDPANGSKYAILTQHEWALLCILQTAKVAPFDAINLSSPNTYIWVTDYEIGEMQRHLAAYDILIASPTNTAETIKEVQEKYPFAFAAA